MQDPYSQSDFPAVTISQRGLPAMSNPSEEIELQNGLPETDPMPESHGEDSSAAVDGSIPSTDAVEVEPETVSAAGEETEGPNHVQPEAGSDPGRSDSAAGEQDASVGEGGDLKLQEAEPAKTRSEEGVAVAVPSSEEAAQPELEKEDGGRTFTMRDLLHGLKNDEAPDARSADSQDGSQQHQILYQDSATAQLISSIGGVDDQGRPRQRMLALAAKRFASAIERNPEDYDALYNWALILQESADGVEPDSTSPSKDALLEEACRRYEEATRLCPTLHDAYYNWAIAISDRARMRGRTKEGEEMWKEATKHYEKAVQLNWNSPQALNNWGLALQELSAIVPVKEKLMIVRRAISKFRAAIQLQYDFHRAIYNLGTVLYALAEDMVRDGGSGGAKEASSNYLYSQCAIYIAAAYALKPNNSVYRSALRLVRSMLPLPYLKVGYLTAPPPGNAVYPHHAWKRTQFILNHEGLFQLLPDDQNHLTMSLSSKPTDSSSRKRQSIKVEIPDIVSISACADLTLPPGAGLFIDTTHGPLYLVELHKVGISHGLSPSSLVSGFRWPHFLVSRDKGMVADSWESLDGWLDAIRLVYTVFAKGKTDVLAGIITG